MDFLNEIKLWQISAREIEPPPTPCKARGGLPGPAFFPEGMGLLNPGKWIEGARPLIMVVGHNFGSCGYRDGLEPKEFKLKRNGREDGEPTWKHLASLLQSDDVKISINKRIVSIDDCFMTNWFIGLLPGTKNKGSFLVPGWDGEQEYESKCLDLLKQQIKTIQPRLMLLLGKDVVQRASLHFTELKCWRWETKTAPNWDLIHAEKNVTITSLTPNPLIVAGLSHTSYGHLKDVVKTNLAHFVRCSLSWARS